MNEPTPGADSDETAPILEALRSLRPDFRRAIAYLVVALAALISGNEIGGVHSASLNVRIATYALAAVLAVSGAAATRSAAREIRRITEHRAGPSAATPLRLTALLGGYLFVVIAVCELCGLNIRQLLVGGAITGIVVGLAAQPILSNLFAGVVLLFARPYVPGQRIRVYSGAINGPHDGVVISAKVLYTVLQTADGPLNIPNSALLGAAVGPPPVVDADEPAGAPPPAGSPAVPPAFAGSPPDAGASPDAGAAEAAIVIGGAESDLLPQQKRPEP